MVDEAKLRQFCTAAVPFLGGLQEACKLFMIDKPLREQHFLAQCAHESGGFTVLIENLNYSADALLRVFPRYFTSDRAAAYARQPEKIANHVYANRMGNGPEESGEGYLYRGRGLIQLTGKANYLAVTRDLSVMLDCPNFGTTPDAASEPRWAPLLAGWFWRSRNINAPADRDDLVAVTKLVNGGTIGIEDRQAWLDKAKGIFK